jgi:amino acid permease
VGGWGGEEGGEGVEEQPWRVASNASAFFNFTKCFVGAASFELPWAMGQAGWLMGTLCLLGLGVLSTYSFTLLIRCADLVTASDPTQRRPSFPAIGMHAAGPLGAGAAWFGIFTMLIGVVGSYFAFIGQQVHLLALQLGDVHISQDAAVMLIAVPIVSLLSLMRSYHFLAPTSLLGVLALIASVVFSLVDGFTQHSLLPLSDLPLARGPHHFGLYLGNAAFLYLISSAVLPIQQTMKRPSAFPTVFATSVAAVTLLNLLFANLMLFLFGSTIAGNALDNMTVSTVGTVVRVCLSLDLLFTSALFILPVAESAEAAFFAVDDLATVSSSLSITLGRNAFRISLVLCAAGLAIGVSVFQLISGLTGGFGNCLLGVVLPPLFYILLQRRASPSLSLSHFLLPIVVHLIGWGMFFFSTIQVLLTATQKKE